jgi:hypothetical protein
VSWRKVEEAATRAVAAIREAYAKPLLHPRIGGQQILHPMTLLDSTIDPERVIHEHLRRMVVHANHTMMTDNWRVPGEPHFAFAVEKEEAHRAGPNSYGPGTLTLRLDMGTRESDLLLPEANAKLTEALIGALCVAAARSKTVHGRFDDSGERLLEGAARALHAHGHPETITLMAAMVEAAGARKQ